MNAKDIDLKDNEQIGNIILRSVETMSNPLRHKT